MIFDTVQQSIENRFETDWGTTSELTFDNLEFKPPTNDNWVRLSIRFNPTSQATLGDNPVWRTEGVAIAQVFVPDGEGLKPARVLGNSVASILQGKQFDGITFRGAEMVDVGRSESWWQVNVVVPFKVDADNGGVIP